MREESLAPRRKVFGELRPRWRTLVAAKEGGLVVEASAREGDRIESGATVARLDGTRLGAELKVLEANRSVAEATVSERERERDRAARDLDLLGRAAEQGGTNPRELADAKSALAVASAQVTQAAAAVTAVEAQIALLRTRIADLEVRAPFAGVVTARRVELGGWVPEGGAVIELTGTDQLEGWFDLPQELFEAAQSYAQSTSAAGGAAIAIEIRTASGSAVRASSVRVVPEIDERARTFHAIATVPNPDGRIAAGLSVTAFVPQGLAQPWSIVPKDALVYQGVNASVYLVRDGKALPVPVRVAFPMGDEVAIEPGVLPAGAQVVVEGNERLMPGATVSPATAAEERK